MAKATYKIISIDGRLYLSGKPVFVIDGPFDLKVGDAYTQIGNKPERESNHFDEFSSPVTYAGSIFISEVRYLAFKIDTQVVISLKIFDKVEPLYMLYIPHGINMIFSYDYKAKKYLIFKPVFKKQEINLEKNVKA